MEEQSLDLTTCCVCFESFDLNEHKPKYLPCSHTLCLICLKVHIINFLIKGCIKFNLLIIYIFSLYRVLDVIDKIVWPVPFARTS